MIGRRVLGVVLAVSSVGVTACSSSDDETTRSSATIPTTAPASGVTNTGVPTSVAATTGAPPTTAGPVTSTTPVPTTAAPTTAGPTSAAPTTIVVHTTLPVAAPTVLSIVDRSRPTSAAGGGTGSDVRTIVTDVYLPNYETDPDPKPLIVLAHGFTGHPDKFTQLASAWAAAGFVVAVPKFPLTNNEVVSPQLGDLAEQGADVDVVIDELLDRNTSRSDVLAGTIDPERIGLYGLSLGSLTVWGTLVDGCCRNRIDALVQSDGAFPGDASLLADVRIPVMIAHSDTDAIFPIAGIRAEYRALRAPKYFLTLHGFAHAVVGENTPTTADDAYIVATTVFWRRHLLGATADSHDGTFPDMVTVDGITSLASRE